MPRSYRQQLYTKQPIKPLEIASDGFYLSQATWHYNSNYQQVDKKLSNFLLTEQIRSCVLHILSNFNALSGDSNAPLGIYTEFASASPVASLWGAYVQP